MKYYSRNLAKSASWLMRQQEYAEHLTDAPQHSVYSDTPPKHLYTEMYTVDWW
jgi:hypothetical protein